MACYVHLMRREDVAPVTEIDREAFPALWPPVSYKRELENRLAHYIVACDAGERVDQFEGEAPLEKDSPGLGSRVRRLFNHNRFFRYQPPEPGKQYITGFTGFWIMADEAHITNIAVRRSYQRRGIGELLLISLFDLAKELKTDIITLEVRASNVVAQNLYFKCAFTEVGTRYAYYTDNREDGLIMSTENITSVSFQTQLKQLKQAHHKKWGAVNRQLPI